MSSVTANIFARPSNIDHWKTFQTEADKTRQFIDDHGLNDGTVIMISGDLHTGGGIDKG